MKYQKLKLNDTVWIASYPLMSYKVTAIITRDKNTQYEIDCLDCNHSGSCTVLIGSDDHGDLVYKGMTSENEDCDDRQYYFHNNGVYKTSKEEAYIYRIHKYIATEKESIEKHKKGIEYNEREIKKLNETLEMYEKSIPTQNK